MSPERRPQWTLCYPSSGKCTPGEWITGQPGFRFQSVSHKLTQACLGALGRGKSENLWRTVFSQSNGGWPFPWPLGVGATKPSVLGMWQLHWPCPAPWRHLSFCNPVGKIQNRTGHQCLHLHYLRKPEFIFQRIPIVPTGPHQEDCSVKTLLWFLETPGKDFQNPLSRALLVPYYCTRLE